MHSTNQDGANKKPFALGRNPDRPDIFSPTKQQRQDIKDSMNDVTLPSNSVDFISWSNQVCMRVGDRLNLHDRIYKTKSQLALYEHLWIEATHLSTDKYRQRGDQSSWTLMGVKGIGKTAALRNFTDVANVIFPTVVPVYISFNNVGLHDFCLKDKTICDAIFEELRHNWDVKVSPAKRNENKSSHLERTLLENNLSVLLLVDELDQLYRRDDPTLHSYLFELISFANNPLGRIGTTICGSSAAMMDLITCNGGSQMSECFPNLKGAPHMNESKFPPIPIPSNLPMNIEVVSEITNIPITKENIGILRLIMFSAGSDARRVSRQMDRVGPIPQDSLSSRNIETDEASMLWNKMCDAMIQKNIHIFDKIVGQNELQYDSIMNEPWETEFQPLTYSEVTSIWNLMITSGFVTKGNEGNLVMRLFDLSDRSWIVLDGVKDESP